MSFENWKWPKVRDPSLRSKVLSGAAWTIAGFGSSQIIRLGSSLVLTRLLYPEAFGLIALVNVFLMGLGMFSDLGLAPNIVQNSRGDDPDFLNTAWTVQVARGTILWFFAYLLASPASLFYDQPELRQLVPVAGLSALIAGFNSTGLPRLQRHLAVAKFTLITLTSHVCSVAVMIAWAMVHPTVWALVAGAVASSVMTLGLSHLAIADERNRFGWERNAARELLHFGRWIFLSTLLAFLVGQSDRLIFGKLMPLEMLGVYSIALMFSMVPSQVTNQVGTSVVFPALSRIIGSKGDLAAAFRRVRLAIFALGGLVVVCLFSGARPLIEILYDPRYESAGWILELLVLGTWFQILEVPSGSALLASGLPRWLAAANGFKLLGIASLTPLGFWLGGFRGAISGFVAAETLRYAVCALGARRLGLKTLNLDLFLSAWVGLAACAGRYASTVIGTTDASVGLSLAGAVSVAFVIWLPVAIALLRAERYLLRSIVDFFRHAAPFRRRVSRIGE